MEETTGAVETTGTVENTVTPSETEPTESAPSEPNEPSDISISVDERGNRKLNINADLKELMGVDEPKEEAEPTVDNEPEEAELPKVEEPQYYASMDEFVKAASMGVLDESRVSPEQRQTLMNLAMQKQYEQQQAQQMQQLQEKRNAEIHQAFKDITAKTRAEVLNSLNISEEDFQNLDYMDNGDELRKKFQEGYEVTAMNRLKDYLTKVIGAEQRMAEHQNCVQEINRFCVAEQASEPHFNEIVAMMDNQKNDMPYGQAQKIIRAEQNLRNQMATANDLAVVREYYDYCKKAVYQQKAGVSKVPQRANVPKVENVSQPTSTDDTPKINFEAIRNMPSRDRSNAMANIIANMM